MIKTEYKTYQKIVSEEVANKMFCDYCKKEIKYQEKFIKVSSSHFDWGNDSCDSFQNSDVHEYCLQNYLKWLFSNESTLCSLHNRDDWKVEIKTDICYIKGMDE